MNISYEKNLTGWPVYAVIAGIAGIVVLACYGAYALLAPGVC